MNEPARRLLFVVNNAAYFASHRLPLAVEAQRAGWKVHLVIGQASSPSREAEAIPQLERHGLSWTRVGFASASLNPITELAGFLALCTVVRRFRPTLVHGISPKGVLYGGLAAWLAPGARCVFAISGLGYAVTMAPQSSLAVRLLVALYWRVLRLAFARRRQNVIVQNPHDGAYVESARLARPEQICLIPGSGVDLDRFRAPPAIDREALVVLPARMIRDKGIEEFVRAAAAVRRDHPQWRFVLAGIADYESPSAISPAQLEAWCRAGDVEWWGHVDDMPALLARTRIVCLPSYREGMSKSLIEAAAAGCAVVTTDVPGCRDAIEVGVTGVTVPPRDADALHGALRGLIEDPTRLAELGAAGPDLAARKFSIGRVVETHLRIYEGRDRPDGGAYLRARLDAHTGVV